MAATIAPLDGPSETLSGRLNRLLASAASLGVVVVIGVSLLIWIGLGMPRLPMSFVGGAAGVAEISIIALLYGGIGAFLATRLPGHFIGWGLLLLGIGVALHLPVAIMIGQASQSFRPIPTSLVLFAWALTASLVPGAVGLIAIVIMTLPDGRLTSRRWRLVAGVTAAGVAVMATATALHPNGLVWFPTVPSPIALPARTGPLLDAVRLVGVGLLVVGLALAAAGLVNRYRQGGAVTRPEMRWIVGGTVIWAATLAPMVVVRYAMGVSDRVGELVILVASIGTCAFAISIFVATTRYHLFGVKAIVGRTLIYVPLMAICAGLYTAAIALSQRLFVATTGATSDFAIVFATLVMAAAFAPVRRGLEAIVERLMARAWPQALRDEPEVEYRRLRARALVLSARLTDVEQRLADMEHVVPIDPGRWAGEPGVGLPSSAPKSAVRRPGPPEARRRQRADR